MWWATGFQLLQNKQHKVHENNGTSILTYLHIRLYVDIVDCMYTELAGFVLSCNYCGTSILA